MSQPILDSYKVRYYQDLLTFPLDVPCLSPGTHNPSTPPHNPTPTAAVISASRVDVKRTLSSHNVRSRQEFSSAPSTPRLSAHQYNVALLSSFEGERRIMHKKIVHLIKVLYLAAYFNCIVYVIYIYISKLRNINACD